MVILGYIEYIRIPHFWTKHDKFHDKPSVKSPFFCMLQMLPRIGLTHWRSVSQGFLGVYIEFEDNLRALRSFDSHGPMGQGWPGCMSYLQGPPCISRSSSNSCTIFSIPYNDDHRDFTGPRVYDDSRVKPANPVVEK